MLATFRKLPRAAAPAALAALALSGLAVAQESPTQGAVATLDLAARLYANALATDDALAAVTAFRLAQSVTLRAETDWQKETVPATEDALEVVLPDGAILEAGEPPPQAEGTSIALTEDGDGFSALAMVTGGMEAATRDMAAGDEDLLALLDDAAAETARGRIGGANQDMSVLAPGMMDTWEIPFAGMERAEIGVFGDGTGGLGWLVSDAAGLPVCIQHYSEEPLYCAFTPRENAFYTVTIISRSDADAQYLLATN